MFPDRSRVGTDEQFAIIGTHCGGAACAGATGEAGKDDQQIGHIVICLAKDQRDAEYSSVLKACDTFAAFDSRPHVLQAARGLC